jgi:outer membrane receptor protein involved in Fe transport
LNGDDSDFEACIDDPGFLCESDDGEEEFVLDTAGNFIPAGPAVEGAAVNRTRTGQDGIGFGIQGHWQTELAGKDNRVVVGLVYDDSSIEFAASSELAALDRTRLAVPAGVYVGDSLTRLNADTSNVGLFVSDTLTLAERVHLTVSGRFNDTEVVLRDRIGTALNGDHSFDRVNLGLGLTARLSDHVTVYAGVSQASRAPSPVELTCADEDDPCRLPNAFLADPPLEQVVAQTFETGLRGTTVSYDWHAGLFRTTSRDDILFISAGALTGQGYFDNVGRTRREGVELNVNGEVDNGARWFASYTLLNATFRENLVFSSPSNPAAIDGEVAVRPGDRLPLIPGQLLKGGLDVPIGDRFRFGATVNAVSGFYLRGDEGNDTRKIGRTVTLNLNGDYRISARASIFLKIDNLLDRNYETFGLFGEPDEVLGDDFDDPQFLSPAAPRAAWAGIRFDFD